ncbi:hypothetical protein [Nonomuraea candida]|uniref:hypothetical protein n=1 Tax=Nonomuraea candida TaxID=359159 RepID=UPI0005BD75FB|nr:hypothetical protein [Nonomuraea candida]
MESLEDRVARLEKQVAYLNRHLGIDPRFIDSLAEGPSLPPDFYRELGRGKLVKAIKIYREATGSSLLVAKNAVEAMAKQARSIE